MLAERIRGEVEDLERVLRRCQHAWDRIPSVGDEQDIYTGYAATGLQSFYTGLERVFQLIADVFEEEASTGETWHIALLQQMTQATGVRPPLLSAQSAADLDEFRRFRHVVRHIYIFNVDAAQMAKMFALLPEMLPRLWTEMLAFADYLDMEKPDRLP